MKKRILYLLLALVLVLALSVPALAAETFYPVSVDEYTAGELDEPRINKVYRLSLSDDPSAMGGITTCWTLSARTRLAWTHSPVPGQLRSPAPPTAWNPCCRAWRRKWRWRPMRAIPAP